MSLDLAELQNDLESAESKAGFLDKKYVRLPEEDCSVIIRILPPAPPGTFGRAKSKLYASTRIHRVNGKNVHCPKTMVENRWIGKCVVCDYYNSLWENSKKVDKEKAEELQGMARAIKPNPRWYFNVIVRKEYNQETNEEILNVGPKIWSVPKTVYEKILRAILGSKALEEAPLGDITDIKTGRDFKIIKQNKKGSGNNKYPSYDLSKFLDPSPLGTPDQVEKWMGSLHDLEAERQLKDMDWMRKQLRIHTGLEKDDETDFNGEEWGIVANKPATVSAVTTAVPSNTPSAAEMAAIHNLLGDDGSKTLDPDDDFLAGLRQVAG